MAELMINDMGGEPLAGYFESDGYVGTTFGFPPQHAIDVFKGIPDLKIRDDDVFLSTPIKSGTHWCFEIISQLRKGKAESTPLPKAATMIELTSAKELDAMPSPRVLNSHMPFNRLPKGVREGKCKIVLVLRNPKDAFVSMYEHHRGASFHNYNGTFENYLPLLLQGKLEYGSWFDIVRGWEETLKTHSDRIHLMFYEDLKKNCVDQMRKLARFLDVPAEENLLQEIAVKCSFDNMKVDKAYEGPIAEQMFRPGFNIFRTGNVGDWKKRFTVAQNEEFDRIYQEKMKGSNLKFRFTLQD